MRLVIAGSRSITDYEALKQAIKITGLWKRHKTDPIEVVCGMALHWKWKDDPLIGGVDRLGYNFAKKNNLTLYKFPADWTKHGNAAGNIRNREMAIFASKAPGGALLALWDGDSTGTKNMIEEGSELGLEVFPLVTKMEWTFNGRTAHGCCPDINTLKEDS